MSESILRQNRRVWDEKPALRTIYTHYYTKVKKELVTGGTLEIGGGTGNFKAFAPDVLSTDIVATPWIDLVADAQALPFADGCFSNLVMLDVLHHIEQPMRFFLEAQRILRGGGHLVMIEPYIGWLSWPFYYWFHTEPVDMSYQFDGPLLVRPDRKPFDANQAIPTLIFMRQFKLFSKHFCDLSLIKADWFDLLAYPLSGGFRKWSLINANLASLLLRVESKVPKVLRRIVGFRLMVVLEKSK